MEELKKFMEPSTIVDSFKSGREKLQKEWLLTNFKVKCAVTDHNGKHCSGNVTEDLEIHGKSYPLCGRCYDSIVRSPDIVRIKKGNIYYNYKETTSN